MARDAVRASKTEMILTKQMKWNFVKFGRRIYYFKMKV